MDTFEIWSKFLREHVPRLLTELKTIHGTPSHQYGQQTQYPDIAYMNYYTREQREPEFVDYCVHSDIHGNISTRTKPMDWWIYNNNDHMFKLVLLSNLQQNIEISVYATEFLNPLDMDETTNQLYCIHYSDQYGPGSPDLPNRCKKIVWNWLQDCIYRKLCAERTALFKKELVAAAWHPRRVSAWLEAGAALEDL